MPSTHTTVIVDFHEAESEIRAVREAVFAVEQGIDPRLDFDGKDADCVQALVHDAMGEPLATGRMEPDGHIGRVAVLHDWRGEGMGAEVVNALMAEARRRGLSGVYLHAQLHAKGFYLKLGFEPVGEVFEEAGIPHVKMASARA